MLNRVKSINMNNADLHDTSKSNIKSIVDKLNKMDSSIRDLIKDVITKKLDGEVDDIYSKTSYDNKTGIYKMEIFNRKNNCVISYPIGLQELLMRISTHNNVMFLVHYITTMLNKSMEVKNTYLEMRL